MRENIAKKILYEDDQIIVCRKKAGIAVQTKKLSEPDLYSQLMNYLAMKGEKPYIGIIHRLDQPVEGVMVFAKTKEAAAILNKQLQQNGFGKYYLAVTLGNLPKEHGELMNYLLKDGKTNTSTVVEHKTMGAKKAVLTYEVINHRENLSLVRIKLETGRHHQIRVQMAHLGCPLVGDRKYSSNAEGLPEQYCTPEYLKRMQLALCSCRLEFKHPQTEKHMEFEIQPEGEVFSWFA